jgi:hypothetical protein
VSALRAAAHIGACAALLLGVGAGLLGCTEATPRRGAPTTPRATVALEPPSFGVGQVATLEIAVVTPPDHIPRPFVPPQQVPGLWVLGTEPQPVRKEEARWIHSTLVRVRARTTGELLWPAGRIEIEGPDGSLQDLPLDALPIEVTSVRPEYPDRITPFGVRSAATPPRASGLLLPAAGGALLALAGVALARVARRRWSQRSAGDAAPAPEPPWTRARAELYAARALAAAEPFAAAHATHAALRRYMTRRFGAAAASCTTEEIAAAKPPFAARSRWLPFVEMLRSLDEFRFLPESDPVARRALTERLGGVIEAGESLVADSTPPEPLQ